MRWRSWYSLKHRRKLSRAPPATYKESKQRRLIKKHVWSLTQLKFVGILQSRLSERSVFCFFVRYVKVAFRRCPRTYETSVTHLSISWYLNISRKKHTRQRWGSLKGANSSQRALQGTESKTKELLGGIKEKNFLP